MQKVLIADDERKVGFLIKSLIQWDRLDLEFAGLVKDGVTAYEKIREIKPDIVITDIRMPGLSGLELIRKVTESELHPHFIVISGYKYFEYAQQAIKYGVEDYLLKPVDETELNEILKRICEKERNRQRERGHLYAVEQKLSDSKYVLHREFLNSITAGEAASLESANKNYGLSFGQGIFRVFCMKVDRDIRREKNEQQMKLILRKLEKIVEQEFSNVVRDMAVTSRAEGTVMAVLNYPSQSSAEAEAALSETFKKSMNYLDGFEHYEMTMGVSEEQTDFGRLSLAVESAREAAACRILNGMEARIDSRSLPRDFTVCAEEILEMVREKYLGAVEIARFEDIRYQVGRAFAEARKRQAFGSEYYRLAKRLLDLFLDKEEFDEPESKGEKRKIWEETVDNCRSRSELEEFVADTVERELKEGLKNSREKERRPILEAISYMKEHYGEKLSLEDLSERSGFNMNYFSELFKKETGKTFTAYLAEVRMEEAKRLLRDTGDAVYEIAEKVGYRDAKFFSQQFAKIVGIKPAEYRKLYY